MLVQKNIKRRPCAMTEGDQEEKMALKKAIKV